MNKMTPAKGLEIVKQNIDIAFYVGEKAMKALEDAVKEPAPAKVVAKPKATTKSK